LPLIVQVRAQQIGLAGDVLDHATTSPIFRVPAASPSTRRWCGALRLRPCCCRPELRHLLGRCLRVDRCREFPSSPTHRFHVGRRRGCRRRRRRRLPRVSVLLLLIEDDMPSISLRNRAGLAIPPTLLKPASSRVAAASSSCLPGCTSVRRHWRGLRRRWPPLPLLFSRPAVSTRLRQLTDRSMNAGLDHE